MLVELPLNILVVIDWNASNVSLIVSCFKLTTYSRDTNQNSGQSMILLSTTSKLLAEPQLLGGMFF